ncbi:MAG: acyl-CoA dehydrogenase C-terminal domain-containing protein [Trueperaceae bacterium]|nr:acyl-CoA dehydrogenase C-terminal domain-containing protein [Trueperaceae bacterium]
MPTYKAPLRDMRFVLHEWLEVHHHLKPLDVFADVDNELIDQVLEESSRFAENVIFPLNQTGDQEGCTYQEGEVKTPAGFKEAFRQYSQAGWLGLDADPDYGGQGLPKILGINVGEMIGSANTAWAMYPGLSRGAAHTIHAHGDEASKTLYIPKLLSGEWAGTMCLTEAHAGTDLGMIRTKAEPLDDGSFSLTGQKIFISAGEHDMTENIIHLVLAKLPNAPEGTKGISLFIVPKYLVNPDGSPGERNGIVCGSIEHKMGINGSATAVLNLDKARGYLIGGEHNGMRCMFTMMNAARLDTGMQGLSLGEVSFQNALAYARDRIQSRSISGTKAPEREADPIIVHADVRRMLLTQKAYNEGARAFANWLALQLDIEKNHPDDTARTDASDLVALLTPVAKAFMTDNGYEVCNLGMQVYGGHGYIKEWGMEQYVRDVRISQIYEGTNGIQALDLIGRKVLRDGGEKLKKFGKLVETFIKDNSANEAMSEFVGPLAKLGQDVQETTMWIGMQGMQNPDEVGAAATNYLRLVGHLVYAYLWASMAQVALSKTEDKDGFYKAKVHTARFYYAHLLPETSALKRKIKAGSKILLELDEDVFAF